MSVKIYSTEYYNEYCIFDTLYIFARYELFHFCNFKKLAFCKIIDRLCILIQSQYLREEN